MEECAGIMQPYIATNEIVKDWKSRWASDRCYGVVAHSA